MSRTQPARYVWNGDALTLREIAERVPSIADIRRDFPELGRSCLYRWHKALQAAHLAKGAELQDQSAASPARCRSP